jgi:integrase
MNKSLEELLMKNKPEMKEATLKQHVSALAGLYKYGRPREELDVKWFEDHDEMSKLIEQKTQSVNTRKNYYCALFILTRDQYYRHKMLDNCKLASDQYKTNQRTEKQQANWMSYDEVMAIVEKFRKQSKPLFSPAMVLDGKMLSYLSDFIALCLTTGAYIPPRRTADWTNFKIRNVDKAKDNYMEGNKFVFNNYKTHGAYGKQEIEIPKPLMTIMKAYIKKNPYDHLLINSKGEPVGQTVLTQRLNGLFGKNISTSMLRHIYLTHKYEGIDVGKLKEIAEEMGHDISRSMEYVVR